MKPAPLEQDTGFLHKTISSLTDQIDLIETFQSLSLKIISQFDLDNIFSTFSSIVKEVIHYNSARIYLYNPSDDSYRPAVQAFDDTTPGQPVAIDGKVINWVMEQGRWTVVSDLLEQTGRIESVLPIKSPKQTHGYMVIRTGFNMSAYNKKTASILEFVASQAAIAIENQGLYARINQSNAYMKDLLESISNGIIATDLNGNVTMVNKNATAILGLTGKKIIGRQYSRLVSGKLKEKFNLLFTATLSGNLMPEVMISHTPFKGVDIFVGITASPLTDKEKEHIGVIFSLRDMSASKEIERLTRLDQMKSEFVSNVSHELRTPLSIIKSYTEALISQVSPADVDTREQFLSVIDNETDRLAGIVGNLLDLSRMESGKFALDYQPVDMVRLISTVVSVFKPKLKNVGIFTEFAQDLPLIDADEEKIKEVLVNLISNAVKFSPMGGIIQITLEQQKGYMICSVADTGIGIKKVNLNKIFGKFFRVDSSDTYEIEGTGLGLSIVKHILELHGGTIDVNSIFGKGSVFTFCLPLTKESL